jgi:hypothetical protein
MEKYNHPKNTLALGYTLSGVGADKFAPTEGQVISRMFVIGFKIWTVIYFHLP